ncbi:hypothetical protein ABC397_13505 [Brevundimonas sp. 2P06AA]|uniref:GHMP family kinase ATP-binding protein n=1 Tax=unclassified Brevundimonas TaxID=2622653 RepID=UPI0039A395A7
MLSCAIDKYVYISANPKFDGGIRLAYSQTEEVSSLAEIQHRLFRHTLEMLQVQGGVEVTTTADIPSRGTGLGSSSAFTVGLLNVMKAYLGECATVEHLAAKACEVEIERCGEPIGKQDQYASAFGGMNVIEFQTDETVQVQPVQISPADLARLQAELLMFYTGTTRSASQLLVAQNQALANDLAVERRLLRMVDLVYRMRTDLEAGRIEDFGATLHENWLLKRELASGISSSQIDAWYAAALSAGATGGSFSALEPEVFFLCMRHLTAMCM